VTFSIKFKAFYPQLVSWKGAGGLQIARVIGLSNKNGSPFD
jgi:hypothetical protein